MQYVAVMLASLFVSLALRWAIAGERFDRALHRVDPTYRSFRDIGRDLVRDPTGAIGRLPDSFGRYYGHYLRGVDDPTADNLRREALRAFAAVMVVAFPVLLALTLARRRLQELGILELTAIVWSVSLVLYWLNGLRRLAASRDRPPLIAFFMLLGVGASVAAVVVTVMLWSRAS